MYYGFNGENWFDAADDASNQWVIDATPESIAFTLRFRADKEDFNPADINALIALNNKFIAAGKLLNVIYCINVRNADKQLQVDRLNSVISAGVNVVAVEFGNETYSKEQANFDFTTYSGWFVPLKALIQASYPYMPLLIFLAPRPMESGVLGGRRDHSSFNNAAISYINSNANCFPTVHIYLNERECPIRTTEIAKRVYSKDTLDIELNNYYNTLYDQAMANYYNLWDLTLNYIMTATGKQVYITEWGFDNYGDIKNTLGTAEVAFQIWHNFYNDSRIAAMLQHNGLSKASPGMIFPAHPDFDIKDPSSNNLRRLDYWVFQLIMKAISDSDWHIVYRATDMQTAVELFIPQGHKLTGVFYQYLGDDEDALHDRLYSSGGATAWMAKGTKPSYDINAITFHFSTPNGLADVAAFPGRFGAFMITTEVILDINEPPVADAGDDVTVLVGERLVLDGSESYDPDGTIVKYTWYDENGIVLSENPTLSLSNFVAGIFVYYLEVEDNKGAKYADSVTVEVIEQPCTKPWWCVFVPWKKRCNC